MSDSRDGWNIAVFSADYKYFVNQWSDRNTPYEYGIFNNSGKETVSLITNSELKKTLAEYDLPSKEFFSFKTSEGVQLNGVMIKPANFDASKKYPVIMWQYSGPGSQQVVNSWNIGSMGQGALLDQYLVQQGFILVCVDGRGTGARGADLPMQWRRQVCRTDGIRFVAKRSRCKTAWVEPAPAGWRAARCRWMPRSGIWWSMRRNRRRRYPYGLAAPCPAVGR